MNKSLSETDELQGHNWNMSCNFYNNRSNPQIEVMPGCFGLMFTNVGDTVVSVNDMILYPSATPLTALGDSRSIMGHWLDVYKGLIQISFRQPLGAAPKIEIVQLFYVKKATTKPR